MELSALNAAPVRRGDIRQSSPATSLVVVICALRAHIFAAEFIRLKVDVIVARRSGAAGRQRNWIASQARQSLLLALEAAKPGPLVLPARAFFLLPLPQPDPGPPPFSSTNSTPADSNARRIAKSLALVSAVWFSSLLLFAAAHR